MNKRTIKAVERRILKNMMEDEKDLKRMLETETEGISDRQLDGLFIRIEQILGRLTNNQNKIMLIQDLKEE